MEKRQILFGTTNKAKIDLIRAYLNVLPVDVLSPKDLRIDIDVDENGLTPEENAQKKARMYFALARIPTFAIDAGLRIEKFPEEDQPGVFVRRVSGQNHHFSDGEIIRHYQRGLEKVGGTSPGTWYIAVSLMVSPEQVLTRRFILETWMTSHISKSLVPGAPLSSLMQDPITRKYYSEMSYAERPDSVLIAEIIRGYIERL